MRRFTKFPSSITAATVSSLSEQFSDIPEDVFEELICLDPTTDYEAGRGGKYCPWILRQYNKGYLTPELYASVSDALADLNDAVQSRAFPTKDIGQYKTVTELLDAANAAGAERVISNRQKKKMAASAVYGEPTEDEAEFLGEEGGLELWTPLTFLGSVKLGRLGAYVDGHDSHGCAYWDTCAPGQGDTWYRMHADRAPLYIFINPDNPDEKYQYWSGEYPNGTHGVVFADIHDRVLSKNQRDEFFAAHPNFADIVGYEF